MSSRIRDNTNKLFEAFFEIGQPLKPSDDSKKSAGDNKEEYEAPIIQQFPPDIEDKNLARTSAQMSFPCEVECTNVELFTFTITDVNSIFRFGFCRHSPGSQTCLVVISHLPWFEVFYKLLNHLAEIINRRPDATVMPLLEAMYNHEVPAAGTPATIVAGQEMFSFNVPDPNVLPSIPASRNLTEYYNAIDPQNMLVIFASLLHERRVIFHSKKLSRVTACTYAAEALLYPMHWQHILVPLMPGHLLEYLGAPMPFIIGIHTSLYKRYLSRQRDCDRDLDVVVVDADNNKVITAHYDVENLPEDVAAYLKKNLRPDKLKMAIAEHPDAISQIFLHALIRLIGGYRDALKFQPDDKITFDDKTFLESRPLHMQPFVQTMLGLQTFNEFLNERIRQLNEGEGFNDVFEKKSMLYSDKLNSDHRYKEWLQNMKKQGKKFQKGSRDVISGIRDKAAPVMSNAMQSVKSGGKRAYSGIKNKFNELNDSSKSSPGPSSLAHDPGRTKSYKSNGAAKAIDRQQRPTTIVGSELKTSRPPRPPPPDYPVARKSAMPSSKPKLLMVSEDDTALDRSRPTSQHLLPALASDLHRSASAENFAQIPKRDLLESEDDSSCSTPPPPGGFTPGDLDSDIPYVDFDAESLGSNASHSQPELVADLADVAEPESRRPVLTQPAKLPVPPPRSRVVRSVPPVPPRSGDQTSAPPAVPPRGNLIKLESSESEPDVDPFDPLARGPTRQRKPENKDSGFGGDLALLQDSSANASSGSPAGHAIMNLSFALADELKTSDSADSAAAATSPGFRRSEGGRSSLIKRTNAFRNPSQDGPVRGSSFRDKDASAENSSLDSLFDPLAAPAAWQPTARGTPTGKPASDKDSPPSLIQDWTLQHLTAPAPQLGPVRQGPPPAPPKPHSVLGPSAHANPLYFTSQPPRPQPRTSQTNPLHTPPRQPVGTSNPLFVPRSSSGSGLGGRGGSSDPFAELAPPELNKNKGPPKRPPPPSSSKREWETFD